MQPMFCNSFCRFETKRESICGGEGQEASKRRDGRRGDGAARKILRKGCKVTQHGAGVSSRVQVDCTENSSCSSGQGVGRPLEVGSGEVVAPAPQKKFFGIFK